MPSASGRTYGCKTFVLCLLWCAALQGWQQAHAYPANQGKIPNGYAVPCLPNNPGCSAGQPYCNGVGHTSCAGGGERNPFGKDFAAVGHNWTRAVCEADSDGDGLTNGEELGDPCCTWTMGKPLEDWQKSYAVSHPGFNTSTSLKPRLRSTWCSASAAPSGMAAGPAKAAAPAPSALVGANSFYNPGERQVEMDFIMKEFAIPPVETIYYDFFFNFEVQEDMDIVGIMPIVGNEAVVHHFVVSLCTAETPRPGTGVLSEQDPPPGCPDTMYAWAPGRGNMTVPADSGFRVGNGTGTYGLVLNVHYNNPSLRPNYTDISGLKVFFTPDLREHKIGVLWTGSLSAQVGDIPPGEPSWFSTAECRMVVDESLAPGGLQVFSYQPHAHYLGRAIWSDQLRSNWSTDAFGNRVANKTKVGELGREDRYDYNQQPQFDFQPYQRIRDGDIVATTCVYDSTSRNYTTRGGPATKDEMCINLLSFYPREAISMMFCQTSVAWSGRFPKAAIITSAQQLIPGTTRPEWDWALEVADGRLQCDFGALPDGDDFEAEFADACGELAAVTRNPDSNGANFTAAWSILLDSAMLGSKNYTAGRTAALQLAGLSDAPSCSPECASFVYNLAACAQTPELKLDAGVQFTASLVPILDIFCSETGFAAVSSGTSSTSALG